MCFTSEQYGNTRQALEAMEEASKLRRQPPLTAKEQAYLRAEQARQAKEKRRAAP